MPEVSAFAAGQMDSLEIRFVSMIGRTRDVLGLVSPPIGLPERGPQVRTLPTYGYRILSRTRGLSTWTDDPWYAEGY